MATKKAKPNGQFYLKGEDVMDFMKDQSVQNIPGINLSSDNCHCYNWILYCYIKELSLEKFPKNIGLKIYSTNAK